MSPQAKRPAHTPLLLPTRPPVTNSAMLSCTTWLARGAALALLFFGAAMVPLVASASVGLKIQTVKVSETLNPGESTEGSIILTNVSDRPVKVTLSVNDFVPLSGAD